MLSLKRHVLYQNIYIYIYIEWHADALTIKVIRCNSFDISDAINIATHNLCECVCVCDLQKLWSVTFGISCWFSIFTLLHFDHSILFSSLHQFVLFFLTFTECACARLFLRDAFNVYQLKTVWINLTFRPTLNDQRIYFIIIVCYLSCGRSSSQSSSTIIVHHSP